MTVQTDSVNVNCHEISFDVKDDQNGETSIAICARDLDGLADCQEIEFIVNAVNDAPILSVVGNQSTDEDEDLKISVSASDVDINENGQSLAFSLECSGDDGLVITSCVSTGDASADCTFDVQDEQNGLVDCIVVVDDGNLSLIHI